MEWVEEVSDCEMNRGGVWCFPSWSRAGWVGGRGSGYTAVVEITGFGDEAMRTSV